MTAYNVIISIDQEIPVDVLTEHIGAALKQFRTPATPGSAPTVTVRKLADGGIVSPPRIGDKIVYNLEGPEQPLWAGETVLDKDTVQALVDYTKALPKLYDQFNGEVPSGRQHPFDGPEMFDDEVNENTAPEPVPVEEPFPVYSRKPILPQEILDTQQDLTGEMYPKTGELLRDLIRREDEGWIKPLDEGEWDLETGDDVGEETD